jgi:3-dehydroquinate synthase
MINKIVISTDIRKAVSEAVEAIPHDRLFLLTDETTDRLCRPLIADIPCMKHAQSIVIGATDIHKNLDTLAAVWTALGNGGGSRHSLMVNLGGGMVTDLGGFAASTFKRGIPYINIPTTLLSMVDASVGGKTGINFNGLKNEIGVFRTPETVIIDTEFLRTLDHENICSGYAEMLKHGLINNSQLSTFNSQFSTLLTFNLDDVDYRLLGEMVGESVAVKEQIVNEDPLEHGIRKALNLGHTIGHAFESWSLTRRPYLHGYAVAWGLICELYLSVIKTGFPTETMRQVVRFIKENYGTLPITCDDYPELYELMTHDKKNADGIINFTLLGDIGDIRINQTATKDEIYETLDFFREG